MGRLCLKTTQDALGLGERGGRRELVSVRASPVGHSSTTLHPMSTVSHAFIILCLENHLPHGRIQYILLSNLRASTISCRYCINYAGHGITIDGVWLFESLIRHHQKSVWVNTALLTVKVLCECHVAELSIRSSYKSRHVEPPPMNLAQKRCE